MRGFFLVIRNEFRSIFRDSGAILILIGALIIYSALYGLIYKPEVVHKMSIAVVDADRSPSSRDLINMLNSTQQVEVVDEVGSLDEARQLFFERQIYGVVQIPKGFEAATHSGRQTHVSIYADGSYFLLYSNLLRGASNVIIERGHDIQIENFVRAGVPRETAQQISRPLQYKVEVLNNPYGGYATALMPGVLIVILQQVILIGIGLVMGSDNEFNRWGKFGKASVVSITLGKLTTYFLLYIPLATYLLWVNYKMFGYPMKGSNLDLALLLVPYLLSSIFAGISFGGLMRRRESSLMYLVVFSVFYIMVSGVSWPQEGMSPAVYYFGKIFPSSSAIEGWCSIRTAGATLNDVSTPYFMLWFLTALYGITAFLSVWYAKRVAATTAVVAVPEETSKDESEKVSEDVSEESKE